MSCLSSRVPVPPGPTLFRLLLLEGSLPRSWSDHPSPATGMPSAMEARAAPPTVSDAHLVRNIGTRLQDLVRGAPIGLTWNTPAPPRSARLAPRGPGLAACAIASAHNC